MITIFTPTYNRVHTLQRLYDSLCQQTCFEFEWLIVDDGSTDKTKELCSYFYSDIFKIRYFRKENGGKHRAINYAVPLAKGEWFFIVDSDDYLKCDAVEILTKELDKIKDDSHFCGVVGLRVYWDGKVIGSPCKYTQLDTDFLSYRIKYKIVGDRAEVVRTSVMKEFPFPEFIKEKFCTEALVWNRIARKYIARYINAKIYYCEYLPGGLSDTYRQITDKSPQASMLYEKERMLYAPLSLKQKIEALAYYMHYARLAHCHFNADTIPVTKMLFYLPFVLIYYVLRFFKRLIC